MNTSPVVRIGAAVALVLGPVTLIATGVAQWFVQPAGEAPTPVDVAGQFPELWLVLGLASVLGPVVWLGGVPSTVTLAPARGSATTRIGAIMKGENPPPDAVIMPPTTPITVDPKTKSTATTASTAKTARDAMFDAGARPLARRSRT